MPCAVRRRRPFAAVVVLDGAEDHAVFVLERDPLAVVAQIAHPRTEDSDRSGDRVGRSSGGFVRAAENNSFVRFEETRPWIGGIEGRKLVTGAAVQTPLRDIERRGRVVKELDVFRLSTARIVHHLADHDLLRLTRHGGNDQARNGKEKPALHHANPTTADDAAARPQSAAKASNPTVIDGRITEAMQFFEGKIATA